MSRLTPVKVQKKAYVRKDGTKVRAHSSSVKKALTPTASSLKGPAAGPVEVEKVAGFPENAPEPQADAGSDGYWKDADAEADEEWAQMMESAAQAATLPWPYSAEYGYEDGDPGTPYVTVTHPDVRDTVLVLPYDGLDGQIAEDIELAQKDLAILVGLMEDDTFASSQAYEDWIASGDNRGTR